MTSFRMDRGLSGLAARELLLLLELLDWRLLCRLGPGLLEVVVQVFGVIDDGVSKQVKSMDAEL